MRTFSRIMAVLLAIVVILGGSVLAIYHFLPQAPELSEKNANLNSENTYNILFCGLDEEGKNTDTILLVSFDAAKKKAKILSIPRDTMSNVDRDLKRINAAYGEEDPVDIKRTIEEIHMLTNLSVDRYAITTFDTFEKLIDALGGVEFDVPQDMKYEDPYQNLKIDLKAGKQTLSGKESIQFLRYRSGYLEGDIGRVKAQQTFYKAFFDELMDPSNITKIPALAKIFTENLDTNLDVPEILWFAKQGKDLDLNQDLKMFILPGRAEYVGEVSYYIPSQESLLKMLNKEFFTLKSITARDLDLVPEAATIVADTGYGTDNDHFRDGDHLDSSQVAEDRTSLYEDKPNAGNLQGNYGYNGAYVPPAETNTGQAARGYDTQTYPVTPAPAPNQGTPTSPNSDIPSATPVEIPEAGQQTP